MEEHPRASKYSARVDRSEANTSHGLVLDLVGSDKRVLDVGCASGYLAEALTAQGNKVSGVELDPDAAEKARPFLDRLVVGNVEELDLVGQFGAGEFDVLVFADVLEHVKDPVSVLRRSRPLLADGGYAVLSIPNVAHGSVRLSLLRGRFDYRPLGLLDDTHLRFFTRSTLDQLVVDAGFVAVDTRQTTAGPFETEIPVSREDYPPDVVAEVEADPESRVYQFVARVEPVDSAGTGLGDLLIERNREVHALRRTLSDIARLAGDGPAHPVVGVLDPGGARLPALQALRLEVSRLELRRRLPGFEIRGFSLDPAPAVTGIGPDGVQSLYPWGDGSAVDLLARVDALVVLPGAQPDADEVVADLLDSGVSVHRMGEDESADPAALAGRLVGADVPLQRAEYLRVMGLIPPRGGYVLHAGGPEPEPGAGDEGNVVKLPGDVSPLDLLGLVANASRVATDDPGLAALAGGLGRPSMEASRRAGAVDALFDDLYRGLTLDAGSRLAATVPQRLADLHARVSTLEAVNAGLAGILSRERLAMANEVAILRDRAETGVEGARNPLLMSRIKSDLDRASAENSRLHAEIDRIYATRTMRTVAPVRRLYGRLRALRP